MKNKNKLIIVGICVCIVCIGILYYVSQKNKDKEIAEILPEEEITDSQLRSTLVSLYYVSKESNQIMPEARLIDVKSLISEPYKVIIELLMEEPKNNSLKSVIPSGSKLNKLELKDDILYIDFSKEFIENHCGGIDEEKNTIYSLVNSLTEFTEINGIKILIENEENKEFKDGIIKFNEVFSRLE